MKLMRAIFYGLCCLMLHQTIDSIHSEEAFLLGNKLVQEKKYSQALQTYGQVNNKGFATLYNMGICSLHEKKDAQATLFFLRAEQKGSWKELTILYNLLHALKKTDNGYQFTLWRDRFALFFKKCILTVSMLLLQFLFLIILILATIYLYRKWYLLYKAMGIGIMFILLISYLMWHTKAVVMQQEQGVTIEKTVLLAGPDTSFYKKADLDENKLVIVLQEKDDFLQIKCDKLIGWININTVGLVNK